MSQTAAPLPTYLYLRASTRDQDASRAEETLRQFAADPKRNLLIVGVETENESGATLKRPALFKILNTAPAGAAILVEQVDRLSRLNDADWQKLRGIIEAKQLRVIALDLPTSHLQAAKPSEDMSEAEIFMASTLNAINRMMLDMLAAISRKDYTDRRRRQAEGIAKARAEGRNITRPVNFAMHAKVVELYQTGQHSKAQIARLAGCSLNTAKNVIKKYEAAQERTGALQSDAE